MVGTGRLCGQLSADGSRDAESRVVALACPDSAPQPELPMPFTSAAILPIVLLCCSNIFMTTAWYGQLKFPAAAMWVAVIASWGIAFFEYCLAVPANRIGYDTYNGD